MRTHAGHPAAPSGRLPVEHLASACRSAPGLFQRTAWRCLRRGCRRDRPLVRLLFRFGFHPARWHGLRHAAQTRLSTGPLAASAGLPAGLAAALGGRPAAPDIQPTEWCRQRDALTRGCPHARSRLADVVRACLATVLAASLDAGWSASGPPVSSLRGGTDNKPRLAWGCPHAPRGWPLSTPCPPCSPRCLTRSGVGLRPPISSLRGGTDNEPRRAWGCPQAPSWLAAVVRACLPAWRGRGRPPAPGFQRRG
jgi:hypothetical protein